LFGKKKKKIVEGKLEFANPRECPVCRNPGEKVKKLGAGSRKHDKC